MDALGKGKACHKSISYENPAKSSITSETEKGLVSLVVAIGCLAAQLVADLS
jgi:hypothetical protein